MDELNQRFEVLFDQLNENRNSEPKFDEKTIAKIKTVFRRVYLMGALDSLLLKVDKAEILMGLTLEFFPNKEEMTNASDS